MTLSRFRILQKHRPLIISFDHFLDPQSMPRLFKTINKLMVDSNFALLTLFQQFTTGGQAGYPHAKMIT